MINKITIKYTLENQIHFTLLSNFSKANDSDLSGVRIKKKEFQKQNPLMSNSFDTYFTSEGTAT